MEHDGSTVLPVCRDFTLFIVVAEKKKYKIVTLWGKILIISLGMLSGPRVLPLVSLFTHLS